MNETYRLLLQLHLFTSKARGSKNKAASQSGKVQVLDYARKPQKALSPNHNKDILLGLIIGLLFGISFVIVIEFLDNSIKNIEYFEKLGLSVLGIIPSIEDHNISDKTSLIFNLFNKKKNNENSNNRRILITRENPSSPISEAYRGLRTSMIYSSENDSVKSIIVLALVRRGKNNYRR